MAVIIPHLYVIDIANTIRWYEKIGFRCLGTHQEEGCELDWAMLEIDTACFMLYPLEGRSDSILKNAGLYFRFDQIDGFEENIKIHAEIIEINPETAYGMQEIVFRDLNGFQVTFGCSKNNY